MTRHLLTTTEDVAMTIATTTAPDPPPPPAAAPEAEPTSGPGVRARLRTVLLRHGYAALALPAGLVALVTAPLAAGAARRVERWRRTLATRLLPVGSAGPSLPAAGATRRVIGHAVVSLPVDLVAFALVVPAWAVFLARGVAYPLFGADDLDRSWGGPTLAGAWFVHFVQGPPLLVVVSLMLAPVSRLQARIARHHFGPGRPG